MNDKLSVTVLVDSNLKTFSRAISVVDGQT